MRKLKKWCVMGLCIALSMGALSSCAAPVGEGDKGDPVAIMLWHYYSGAQQLKFDALTQEFNDSVGREKNIVVETRGYGDVNELNEKVQEAVYEKVGADEAPDIFSSYADNAYELNRQDKLADLSQYLTEEEQSAYITAYLEEGRFQEDGGYKLFPVAKSTEVLTLNKTAWDTFAAETGAREEDLATWEGIAALAQRYYRWTDEKTPAVANDGKAFFGRDAFANYMLIGSRQLGANLLDVKNGAAEFHADATAMRRLWDQFYLPYINGYFNALGKFRSDDVRTGDLIACVGATSGAAFFPTEVTDADGATHAIEVAVYPLPNFEGTEPMAVQQGAGMAVLRSTQERESAAVEFLKWFTAPEQNLRFAAASGYLPVTYAANREGAARLEAGTDEMSQVLRDTIAVGMDMSGKYTFGAVKAFENATKTRYVMDDSMRERAVADRAAVLELMAQGTSREEAVAQYDTDENFNAWLEEFRAEVQSVLGK